MQKKKKWDSPNKSRIRKQVTDGIKHYLCDYPNEDLRRTTSSLIKRITGRLFESPESPLYALVRHRRELPEASALRNRVADSRLTWAARGLLVFMLSHDDSVVFTIAALATHGPDTDIESLLSELESVGYIAELDYEGERGFIVTRKEATPADRAGTDIKES